VAEELSLTYDDLRRLPKVSAAPMLVCLGEFNDTATWSGVPVQTILDMAGVQAGAVSLVMTGADGYSTTISVESALESGGFLAYELEGRPLPALHGFPVRAVFPGEYGSYWVKWLLEIEVR
jgi:DMSO/TMAO reductase YedYZ molybdopterin-dependent catalytic subunit